MSRDDKGKQIFESGLVQHTETGFIVKDYEIDATVSACSCADYRHRRQKCKHMVAVELSLQSVPF